MIRFRHGMYAIQSLGGSFVTVTDRKVSLDKADLQWKRKHLNPHQRFRLFRNHDEFSLLSKENLFITSQKDGTLTCDRPNIERKEVFVAKKV